MSRDTRLGHSAVDRGWLTEAELEQALQEQETYRAQGHQVRLGDLLVHRNLLTEEQLDELLSERSAASQQLIAARKQKNLIVGVAGLVVVALVAVFVTQLGGILEKLNDADQDDFDPSGPGTTYVDQPGKGTTQPGGKGTKPGKGPKPGKKPGGKSHKDPKEIKAGKAALDAISKHFRRNPADYDGTSAKLKAVMQSHPAVAAEARARLKEVEAKREQGARAAYTERLEKGEQLFDDGQVSAALAVFDDYPPVFKVTAWGTKTKEWRAFLLDKARAKIETAADAAGALLEAGKVAETLETLEPVRPYEKLAAETANGAMWVDMVQGLRGRATWLARAEAQKQLEAAVPGLLGALKERRFDAARDAVDRLVGSAGSPVMQAEARFLKSDVRGCERVLASCDRKLRALAAGGATLRLHFGASGRTGTLAMQGDEVEWSAGDTTKVLTARDLPVQDLLALAADTRAGTLPGSARYALGVLALAGDDWTSARDLLAGFRGPRAQHWFRRAESAGNDELERQIGSELRAAKAKVEAHEWKQAQVLLDRLVAKVGWPVDGEAGPRREMADLWSRCASELSGLGRVVAGAASMLPGDRLQIAYDFADEDQLEDFTVSGGSPERAGSRIRVTGGSVAFVRVEFPGDVSVRFRGTGSAFGVAMHARGDSDGYHCWFGKDGEVQIVRDGTVVARGPFTPDTSREYAVTVWRKGAHIQLDIDGREILGFDDTVPISGAGRARLGLLGGADGAMYGTVVITGTVDLKNLKKSVAAAVSARKPPSGSQQLQRGSALSAWEAARGSWKLRKGAIEGNGSDAFLLHREASRWEVVNYTFTVQARRMLRRSDAPAICFTVKGKDVVWVLSQGSSYLLGLNAAFAAKPPDISFKFVPVTVVVKKAKVSGFIGRTQVWEARVDDVTGASSGDFGGALGGFGLGAKSGNVAFRKPVFKASR
ncbi:MAG: hypothetical protein ACYTGX_08010 [Planctomycetota bacterium]|jgi:hypothetical protein